MIRLFLVLFSFYIAFLNFKIYKSYVIQTKVVGDFNEKNYKNENFVILKNSDIEFPNLSGTAFPIYVLLANYHLMYNDPNSALDILNKYGKIKWDPLESTCRHASLSIL